MAAPLHGRVRSLHRKPEAPGEHGLPKPTVDEIFVSPAGVRDDFNRYRHEDMHDAPDQAVLLMTSEMIHTLTAEGIPYGEFHPGDRFRVGSAVLQVTKPCTPCTNLHLLPYVGEERGPRFVRTMVDRRGWYAAVVHEGRVRTGDQIERL